MNWNFDNSYAQLPEFLYARVKPTAVRRPKMALFNEALAESLDLVSNGYQDIDVAILGGNQIPNGADPIAQAYAGHQFGNFTLLGDGRAILLGEHLTPYSQRFDIQLKGSGITPFSRSGDGRAVLGPMLREYIISEAMHALGIPTTRSLAVVTTGESVFRETALPGAILTRVASSHIRVGSFEYIAARGDSNLLQTFANYTIWRHYPECAMEDYPYVALLQKIIDQQAALVAKWMLVGFIHGVMNTDNMALSGETLDYGPCAFMDTYDPATVFSSIDIQYRYAYGNQPRIAQWNLARFAEALLPILHEDQDVALQLANQTIATFPGIFQRYWFAGMKAKLGLVNDQIDDANLIDTLLDWMLQHRADYTNTFRMLLSDKLLTINPYQDAKFQAWYQRWRKRLTIQSEPLSKILALMQANNPAVIPRNYQVEVVLETAEQSGDLAPLKRLLKVLAKPYTTISDKYKAYCMPPDPNAPAYQTFCGT
ncbi:hypothetical protein TI05_11815 [Achromatium sp. WMS3]|nr:hypothetical protein TI05_11815 [Achromatium sp. WMS3]